jgi:hypothetical protein
MKRNLLLPAFLALGIACIPLAAAPGSPNDALSLHLKLSSLATARAPEVAEGALVLSVAGPYRFVGAAFQHEDFARIHAFSKNRQGVFVLAYPVPLKRSEPLAYRLVIDGVWTIDPANPRRFPDPVARVELSVAEIPYISDLRLGVYRILGEDGRTARFVFKAESGQVVTVCGDFDNWDPFIHEMSETSPGLYELELPLPVGMHYYTYIYRGQSLPDPLNPVKATSADGKIVSVLSVQE